MQKYRNIPESSSTFLCNLNFGRSKICLVDKLNLMVLRPRAVSNDSSSENAANQTNKALILRIDVIWNYSNPSVVLTRCRNVCRLWNGAANAVTFIPAAVHFHLQTYRSHHLPRFSAAGNDVWLMSCARAISDLFLSFSKEITCSRKHEHGGKWAALQTGSMKDNIFYAICFGNREC